MKGTTPGRLALMHLTVYREVKRGTTVDFGIRPYFATMPIDNSMHSRKSNARAWKIIFCMQALERTE
jgi:hypothetical protein